MEQNVKIHSVKYNFMMSIILKASSYIFPLITLPYITRTLGAVGNGKVAFAASVINYFVMLSQLGIPTYGIRACAKCRDNKDELTKTVQELLMINTVTVVASYILLIAVIVVVPKFREEPELMIINSFTLVLNMVGMEWLYQAVEQYQYITIRNIAFKIISIVLLFIFVHNPEDYILYGALAVISSGGSNVLNLINCRKILIKKTYFGKYNFQKHMKPIFVFFALSVAVSIYTSMDTAMLGFMSDEKEVAYYALATKVKMILATTISALGPVLLPRMTYCLNHKQYSKFKEYIEKSLHFVLLVAVPVVIFFAVMSYEVTIILGGEEYKPAVLCMQVITLAVLPLGIGNIACSQILTPLGKEKMTMYSTICGAILNLLANAILIPQLGAIGAAIATVLAESVVATVQVGCSWREIKDAFAKIDYFKLLIANVISVFCLMLVRYKLSACHPLLVLVITCVVFFTVYAITLIREKDTLLEQYVIPVLGKICARIGFGSKNE